MIIMMTAGDAEDAFVVLIIMQLEMQKMRGHERGFDRVSQSD